jgi:hypothetical protein
MPKIRRDVGGHRTRPHRELSFHGMVAPALTPTKGDAASGPRRPRTDTRAVRARSCRHRGMGEPPTKAEVCCVEHRPRLARPARISASGQRNVRGGVPGVTGILCQEGRMASHPTSLAAALPAADGPYSARANGAPSTVRRAFLWRTDAILPDEALAHGGHSLTRASLPDRRRGPRVDARVREPDLVAASWCLRQNVVLPERLDDDVGEDSGR